MIEHQKIPITKILSAACRDFMAFSGLHNFSFEDGINTIIGGNASGKTTLLSLITQALSPNTSRRWNGQSYPNTDSSETLLELKFIADNKTHFLRRVISGDTTTDLHLYIGEDDDHEFLHDGDVVVYLARLKPVFIFNSFEKSRRELFIQSGPNIKNKEAQIFDRKYIIEGLNLLLPLINIQVSKIVSSKNEVNAVYRDGREVRLASLSGGNYTILFFLSEVLTVLRKIKEERLSTVILIDEFGIGLDRAALKGLNDAMKEIAMKNDCQFMITSKFVNGRMNPIRTNKFRIPEYYLTKINSNPTIYSKFQKYAKQVSWNWKP